MSRNKDREAKACKAIKDLIDSSDQQTSLIKNRWRENYDMFVYGTQTDEKEEWQTNFSVNKLNTSIRGAQGRLVNILVNNPDWYELAPRSSRNRRAEVLAPAFKKIMDYYLESAKFKRHAGTFFLSSLISSGSMYIGWKKRMVQNPEFVLKETEESRKQAERRISNQVVNPNYEDESLSGSELEQKILSAIDETMAEAQGTELPEEKVKPYIQIGCLDLKDINHEKIFWDPNVMYMEDSIWRAFKYEVNKYELNYMAKLGIFPKSKVKKIGGKRDSFVTRANERLRYRNTLPNATNKSDTVELTVYFGPLIIDSEIVEDRYYALIANDDTVLMDGAYPYWEPPGHHTPIITAAVRQIPYRATGAGIGDSAVALQKIYDSNWQLVCDTFRYGIAGINVVNYQNLVDKSQLQEGIYPGMTLEVRGKPSENFEHVDFTSNIENQSSPVQAMLERAIDNLTGINELMTGGSNPYSRTAAAETNARLDAGQQSVNTIALDLEQNFMVPAMEKIFARVIQFGLQEINTNPELQMLLDEEELNELSKIGASDKMVILNHWYNFKIRGFSSSMDKNLAAQRDNELLQIVNSGGPLSTLINLPELMKEYFKNRDIKDPERLLIVTDSPLEHVTSENKLLLSGHQVLPSEADDHEFHLGIQMVLAQSPMATPEMMQHVQYHQMMLQQMQMAAQQQGGPAGSQGGPIEQ